MLVSDYGRGPVKTIKDLRTERGLRQIDIAAALDVALSTVANWEQRTVEPRATQVRELAKLFSVSMDDIDFEAINRKDRRQD